MRCPHCNVHYLDNEHRCPMCNAPNPHFLSSHKQSKGQRLLSLLLLVLVVGGTLFLFWNIATVQTENEFISNSVEDSALEQPVSSYTPPADVANYVIGDWVGIHTNGKLGFDEKGLHYYYQPSADQPMEEGTCFILQLSDAPQDASQAQTFQANLQPYGQPLYSMGIGVIPNQPYIYLYPFDQNGNPVETEFTFWERYDP